jgi:AcrR family transcriptional regulator
VEIATPGADKPRRGRRPAGSGTRLAIEEAARKQFGELGYRRTTIRGVARLADVDPRLVLHYFGSKKQLFMASVRLPVDPDALFERLFAPGPGPIGERAASVLIGVMEEDATQSVMIGLIRSATSEPEAAQLIREILTERILTPLAERVGGADPELRASLMATQVVGLAMGRHIVAIGPLATASREQLVRAVAPVFDHYLTGDWVGDDDGAPTASTDSGQDDGWRQWD